MKKGLWVVLVLGLFLINGVYGATINAISANYNDVRNAVDSATYGDTVVVPATSTFVEWPDPLVITKYITIHGAGDGTHLGDTDGNSAVTYIKGGNFENSTAEGDMIPSEAIIRFVPDDQSRAANNNNGGLFELYGFKFDGVDEVETLWSPCAVKMDMYGTSIPSHRYKNIKIHDCTFYNFLGYTGSTYGDALQIRGVFGGVAWDNYFWNSKSIRLSGYPSGPVGWVSFPASIGDTDTFFYEDNIFEQSSQVHGGGWGGQGVIRFNEVLQARGLTIVGAHGNTANAVYYPDSLTPNVNRGNQMIEVYCNAFERYTPYSSYTNTRLAGPNGGTWAIWGNRRTDASVRTYLDIMEHDGYYGHAPSRVIHNNVKYQARINHVASSTNAPPNSIYWTTTVTCGVGVSEGQDNCAAPDTWVSGRYYVDSPAYDPQYDTYIWDNTLPDGSRIEPGTSSQLSNYWMTNYFVIHNRDWWKQVSNFDGSSGIGVGTKSQMLAITPTRAGVGFWVTNEGNWNQDTQGNNVLGYTGQGVLYRANSNLQWEVYYTPYIYPHPLRGLSSPTTECSDSIDNDGDGQTDLSDSGCSSSTDNDETNCGDGVCEGGETSVTCSPDCTSPAQELVAHYTFDENSGTVAHDSSGNNNDGTISGATWATGHSGSALSFDGVDDSVIVIDSSSLNPDYITISMWFRPDALVDNTGLIAKGDSANRQYWMWVYRGNLSYEIDEGGNYNYIYSLNANQWHHLSLTYDGANVITYIDGNEVNRRAQATGTILADSDSLSIGRLPGVVSFDGIIDEVRIYNYALTESEILDLFNSQTSICGDVDTSENSVVEIGELISYISSWKNGEVLIGELIDAIGKWKNGC